MPVPVVVVPPEALVSVQLPVDGNPLRTTLPVAREHVGWVIVPTTGAVGVTAVMTTLGEAAEVQPAEFVTV